MAGRGGFPNVGFHDPYAEGRTTDRKGAAWQMRRTRANELVGCCGLYCGLCSKYQSSAPSRCIGCRPGEQHSWCSIWNCCVKKHGFNTCAECDKAFGCTVFLRRRVAEWVPAADNLRRIREVGLAKWLIGQRKRQKVAEELLRGYNDGRSMSFYCKVCARAPIELVRSAMRSAEKELAGAQVGESDMKRKAKVLRATIEDLASRAGIDLG